MLVNIIIGGIELRIERETLLPIPYFRSYLERWSDDKNFVDLSDRDALGLLNVINYVRTGIPLDSRYYDDALYYGINIEDVYINSGILPNIPFVNAPYAYICEDKGWEPPILVRDNVYEFLIPAYNITSDYRLVFDIVCLEDRQSYVNKLAFALIDKIELITYGSAYIIDGIYLDILYNIDKRGDDPFHCSTVTERFQRSRTINTLSISIPMLGIYEDLVFSKSSFLRVTFKDDISHVIDGPSIIPNKILSSCLLRYNHGRHMNDIEKDRFDKKQVYDHHHISVRCDSIDEPADYIKNFDVDINVEGNICCIYIVYIPDSDILHKRYFDYGRSYGTDIIKRVIIKNRKRLELDRPSYIQRLHGNSRIYYIPYYIDSEIYKDCKIIFEVYNIPGTIHIYVNSSNSIDGYGIRRDINTITSMQQVHSSSYIVYRI